MNLLFFLNTKRVVLTLGSIYINFPTILMLSRSSKTSSAVSSWCSWQWAIAPSYQPSCWYLFWLFSTCTTTRGGLFRTTSLWGTSSNMTFSRWVLICKFYLLSGEWLKFEIFYKYLLQSIYQKPKTASWRSGIVSYCLIVLSKFFLKLYLNSENRFRKCTQLYYKGIS